MNQTIFSIIIPLFNKEKYIKATIESVLNQTFSNFELLIIDDSSNDNSFSIASSFTDNRIRLFKKKNGGVSDTRNYGILKANGKFIIFLDADDLWEEDFLKEMFTLQIKYPQAEMFACSYQINNKIIKLKSQQQYIWISDYFKYASKNICWTSALCFKSELVKKTGFFKKGIKRGEDLDYWLRAAINTKGIAYNNKALAKYNTSTENSAVNVFNSYKESFPYWEWYKINNNSKEFYKYVSSMIYMLAKKTFENKKYNETIEILKKIKGNFKIVKRLYLLIMSKICRCRTLDHN